MKKLLALLLVFTIQQSFAQKFTLSGYVRDSLSGEYLPGVNVYSPDLMKGTSTNAYGFYTLTLEKGEYNIVFSYVSYQKQEHKISLNKAIKLNVNLGTQLITTDEIIISDKRDDKNVQSAEVSRIELDIEKIKALPAFLGEVDVLKTIQLLPGVTSGGEGNTGFYVRGGGPDQNLILLDEAVVYNASHLFGFFSVFNPDAVKGVELIKGGMPAQYGGRLASVLDISMKEGNSKQTKVSGGIGLISSRLTVEGPIKKDTTSYLISGRRTYIDALVTPFLKDDSPFKGSGYYFYDLNVKVNHRISQKDRLFFSSYLGRDVFSYNNTNNDFNVKIPWGNTTASLRWNRLLSDKIFVNTTFVFSDYNFSFEARQSDFDFKLFSGIKNYNGKTDFYYTPSVRHTFRFGANYTRHIFTPSNVSAIVGDVELTSGEIMKQYANEAAAYINDEFTLNDRIKMNIGLRYSAFQQVGEFKRFVNDEFDQVTDTILYAKGEEVAFYNGLEPRFTIRYGINSRSSIKASYTYNLQYIHLATLSAVSLPTDIWMPSSDLVRPQLGHQATMGYFRNFNDNMFETSVEVFYKDMRNLVEYKEGTLPDENVNQNPDNELTFGRGEAYGIEFFIKKNYGKLNGWIGYTLARTTRFFDELNFGNPFPATYDRRHDLSIALTYDLNERWSFSAIFVYGTGNAITLPVSRYLIEGRLVNEYSERNAFRMRAYHRADISATYKIKTDKRFKSSWNFAVYNLYNRANPFFIYFNNTGSLDTGTLDFKAFQVSLFPILPSITWDFKF
jgi:hypothetical protein